MAFLIAGCASPPAPSEISPTPTAGVDLSPIESATGAPDAISTATWTATGPMMAGRAFHTATLLPSGLVLVAGGNMAINRPGNPQILAAGELYDPQSGTWKATGTMVKGREGGHTATLLLDGRVLVTGGWSGTASAEIFDPATSTWTATADMIDGRGGHTATLLPNGKVLVAGGYGGSVDVRRSAELYDPITGSWAATGSMLAPHNLHTATLLPDGTVLVAGHANFRRRVGRESGGGNEISRPLPTAELYDVRTGSWRPTGDMMVARLSHTATVLPDGTVLVAGGHTWLPEYNTDGGAQASAELYDPGSGSWMATEAFHPRTEYSAVRLPDGTVLAVGGISRGDSVLDSAELFDEASGSWSAALDMLEGRGWHTATLLEDGTVLIAGGLGNLSGAGALGSAEIFHP